MKRSELKVGTEVAVRSGFSACRGVVLSVFPEDIGRPWAETSRSYRASYCTVAVPITGSPTPGDLITYWEAAHVLLSSVLCDWPTYLERQKAEEKRQEAAAEAKHAAGVAWMGALKDLAELADRAGFEVRITDWGVYIDWRIPQPLSGGRDGAGGAVPPRPHDDRREGRRGCLR